MTRRLIALLFLLSIGVQTFSQVLVVVEFYRNRSYISKNLCENRFRPALNCKGNCVLMKKLKQQEQRNEKETSQKLPQFDNDLSSRSFFPPLPEMVPTSTAHLLPYQIGRVVNRARSHFHPPGV